MPAHLRQIQIEENEIGAPTRFARGALGGKDLKALGPIFGHSHSEVGAEFAENFLEKPDISGIVFNDQNLKVFPQISPTFTIFCLIIVFASLFYPGAMLFLHAFLAVGFSPSTAMRIGKEVRTDFLKQSTT